MVSHAVLLKKLYRNTERLLIVDNCLKTKWPRQPQEQKSVFKQLGFYTQPTRTITVIRNISWVSSGTKQIKEKQIQ